MLARKGTHLRRIARPYQLIKLSVDLHNALHAARHSLRGKNGACGERGELGGGEGAE
jgi:hypothetical protein